MVPTRNHAAVISTGGHAYRTYVVLLRGSYAEPRAVKNEDPTWFLGADPMRTHVTLVSTRGQRRILRGSSHAWVLRGPIYKMLPTG